MDEGLRNHVCGSRKAEGVALNDLKALQARCLDILRDIDRVCRQFQIRYSLCGGSVIGYHLYQGFIPWDDDIDLMMTRENYDKFLEVYPKHCAKGYRLLHYSQGTEPLPPTLFSRVEDLNSELTEKIAGHVRKGHIFVDLTVYDAVLNRNDLRASRARVGWTYSMLYQYNGMTPGTGWKRQIYRLIPKVQDEEKLRKIYAKTEAFCRRKSRNWKKAAYCAELLSAAYGGILYEKRIFDGYEDVEYAGVRTSLIRDYQDYLFMRYGKREFTKEIPDEEKGKHLMLE